jgi:hypothetical protein
MAEKRGENEGSERGRKITKLPFNDFFRSAHGSGNKKEVNERSMVAGKKRQLSKEERRKEMAL